MQFFFTVGWMAEKNNIQGWSWEVAVKALGFT